MITFVRLDCLNSLIIIIFWVDLKSEKIEYPDNPCCIIDPFGFIGTSVFDGVHPYLYVECGYKIGSVDELKYVLIRSCIAMQARIKTTQKLYGRTHLYSCISPIC